MKSTNQTGSRSALAQIILLVLFLVSCNVPVDEYVGRYRLVTNKPDRLDLIGTWIIDQATVKDMRMRGKYEVSRPTEIVLRADDTFEMINLPDWYQDVSGKSHGGLVSLSGKWRLNGDNGFWRVGLDVPTQFAPYFDLREPRYKSQPRYLLEIVLGDPDSGERMTFLKS
jgi:hypothetical protein